MKFLVAVLAAACICIGFFIGVVATQWAWLNWLYGHLPYLMAGIIVAAIMLALSGLLGFLALKWWIKRKLKIDGNLDDAQLVTGLASQFTNRDSIELPTAQDRMHSMMVNFGLYYVRSVALQRYFLVIGGTFTALIGIATVFLLFEQNKKLDEQTEQIKIQSQANTVASLLMEGARRASISAEQTELFANIREEATAILKDDNGLMARECKKRERGEQENSFHSRWRKLEMANKRWIELVHVSEILEQRIRNYAIRATPYPIVTKNNSISIARSSESRKPGINFVVPLVHQIELLELSPERGMLLQTLVINKVSIGQIRFDQADLRGLDLRNAYLADLSLVQADFRGATLSGAVLSRARLGGANLLGAILRDANLNGATLVGAVLDLADLSKADLRQALLTGAFLLGAILIDARLDDASIDYADLSYLGGVPPTSGGFREALDGWLRVVLAPTAGIDTAKLPKGFEVTCKSKTLLYFRATGCADNGGWTIDYVAHDRVRESYNDANLNLGNEPQQ